MDTSDIDPNQLPLNSDYSLSADQDCLDQFPGPPLSSAYHAVGSGLYQRAGTLHDTSPDYTTFSEAMNDQGVRSFADGALSLDAPRYRSAGHFSDVVQGSVAASTTSAHPPFCNGNGNYTHSPQQALPAFTSLQHSYLTHPAQGPRLASITDGIPSATVPSTDPRFSRASTSATGDREPWAHTHSIPSIHRAPITFPGYHDPSRPFLQSPGFSTGVSAMATSNHHSHHNGGDCSAFPFFNLECSKEITCEGRAVTQDVQARVEKGLFWSQVDNKWTCYRRNYFAVNCWFELHPIIANGKLYLSRGGKHGEPTEMIMAMGIRLSAEVDGTNGKTIELVQYTPKRDAGAKTRLEIVKVWPSSNRRVTDHTAQSQGFYSGQHQAFQGASANPLPYLPLQNTQAFDSTAANGQSSPSVVAAHNFQHTFERLQFKSATANNGKRRASQQYFHLVIELFADVRKTESESPVWVKVAKRSSANVVVRGRSPSHYRNETQGAQTRRGGGGGAGGVGGGGGNGATYTITNGGAFGSLTAPSFRPANAYALDNTTGGGNGGGQNGQYIHHGYTSGSFGSSSSPSSATADHDHAARMGEAEDGSILDHRGFRYFPEPIGDGVQLPVPTETGHRGTTDPRYWHGPRADSVEPMPLVTPRLQGTRSSRGYYPDVGSPEYY